MYADTGPGRQRGISFMELVLFIVIVGVALAGILGVMNLTARSSSDTLVRKQALMLAEGFMEEVQLARFTYCDAADEQVETAANADIGPLGCAATPEAVGPEAGGLRPFDNVNDYVGSYGVPLPAFNNGAGALTDAAGGALGLAAYTVALSISPAALGPAGAAAPAQDALLIKVAVSHNGVEQIVLDGYRLRYAPNAVP